MGGPPFTAKRSSMNGSLVATLVALAIGSAFGREVQMPPSPAPAAGPAGAPMPVVNAEEECKKLCMKDKGIDSDVRDCMTECAVYTDLREFPHDGPTQEGLKDFVLDETHNEDGGEEMEGLHDAQAYGTTDAVDCESSVTEPPTFEDMDMNGDGGVTMEEAEEYGYKMCVPNEMVEQIFNDGDENQDHILSKEEYDNVGEDTAVEEAIDEALTNSTQGDDEFNPVQSPTDENGNKEIEIFDENEDGSLDEPEFDKAAEFEMQRRGMDTNNEGDVINDSEEELDEAFDKIDGNDDGKITKDEYEGKSEGSDLGKEMEEAAAVDEEASDPDDLSRAGEQVEGIVAEPTDYKDAPASMLSHSRHHRRVHHGQHRAHHKRHMLGFAQKFQAVARTAHRLRALHRAKRQNKHRRHHAHHRIAKHHHAAQHSAPPRRLRRVRHSAEH